MEGKNVRFSVGMTCEGCSNAVKRILGKIEGVQDVAADVDNKLVVVTCADTVDQNVLLAALQKWGTASGKSVELLAE